jgi:hypothetical protein
MGLLRAVHSLRPCSSGARRVLTRSPPVTALSCRSPRPRRRGAAASAAPGSPSHDTTAAALAVSVLDRRPRFFAGDAWPCFSGARRRRQRRRGEVDTEIRRSSKWGGVRTWGDSFATRHEAPRAMVPATFGPSRSSTAEIAVRRPSRRSVGSARPLLPRALGTVA